MTSKKTNRTRVAFIIGSPRSGTTILGNLLNCHRQITEWYEPYYLWEKYFSVEKNDIWRKEDFSEKTARTIAREYSLYLHKSNKDIVIDKSPTHAFNIQIIHKIFPDAKWIHILRDGRDAVLSIKKEWETRKRLFTNRDTRKFLLTGQTMLKRQPFWRYRFMAVWHEIVSNPNILLLRRLNKARWKGQIGWGPRFKGWENYLETHSSLEFNAMQWLRSVEAVKQNWEVIPSSNRIEIRYENLLQFPEETIRKILELLETDFYKDLFHQIPVLKKNNFNKWKTGFSKAQTGQIKPILGPLIQEMDYDTYDQW